MKPLKLFAIALVLFLSASIKSYGQGTFSSHNCLSCAITVTIHYDNTNNCVTNTCGGNLTQIIGDPATSPCVQNNWNLACSCPIASYDISDGTNTYTGLIPGTGYTGLSLCGSTVAKVDAGPASLEFHL